DQFVRIAQGLVRAQTIPAELVHHFPFRLARSAGGLRFSVFLSQADLLLPISDRMLPGFLAHHCLRDLTLASLKTQNGGFEFGALPLAYLGCAGLQDGRGLGWIDTLPAQPGA